MWPWGHLAVGYLWYVVSVERRPEAEQTIPALCALAVGTQFPDLVDKPLAWTFDVLPSGRSLAHSLLTIVALVCLLTYLGRYARREELAFAFNVGIVTHTISDIEPGPLAGLLAGDWGQLQWLSYLVWPVVPPAPYPNDSSFVEVFAAFTLDPYIIFQFGLFGVGTCAWLATGATGVSALRRAVRRRLGRGT
jgi:hypothetical protein